MFFTAHEELSSLIRMTNMCVANINITNLLQSLGVIQNRAL
jgi:hypothetical protein